MFKDNPEAPAPPQPGGGALVTVLNNFVFLFRCGGALKQFFHCCYLYYVDVDDTLMILIISFSLV